jgi:integrase
VKGGDYEKEEVSHTCWDVLVDYLTASGRLDDMTNDTPLWVGHGRNSDGVSPLSSHAFVKNFKKYAVKAGLGDVHLHQLRHTSAAWIADDTGDLSAVQKFLGHKNIDTTKVYVQRVTVKKDTHSSAIASRLGM